MASFNYRFKYAVDGYFDVVSGSFIGKRANDQSLGEAQYLARPVRVRGYQLVLAAGNNRRKPAIPVW